MKITALDFSLAANGASLGVETESALRTVTTVLEELGDVETEIIDAAQFDIPFYSGVSAPFVVEAAKSVKASDGVIIAVPVFFSGPNAACTAFFEHMLDNSATDSFKSKNCMIICVSDNGGERGALDRLSYTLSVLGAYDAVRIAVNNSVSTSTADGGGKDLTDVLSKQTEDFYRIIKQNRKYIIPLYEGQVGLKQKSKQKTKPSAASKGQQKIDLSAIPAAEKALTAAELLTQRLSPGEALDEKTDIVEITRYFANKVSTADSFSVPVLNLSRDNNNPSASFSDLGKNTASKPKAKNVRQMTASLPHFYQPQLALGLNAVIQITITGDEAFDGYLTISNTECEYTDGQPENKDITITADAKVWSDVLKGKNSAQKAFMIGQLKVRGNFVLLTKFDQLFTLNIT